MFVPGKRFIYQEHMIYNDKGIPALTISAKNEQYFHKNQKYSVFDKALSNEDLKRNILIISEALVKLIYNFEDKNTNFLLEREDLVNDTSINSIKSYLLKNPRAPHLMQRDSKVSKDFQKMLGTNVNTMKRMGVSLKEIQFYEEKLENKITVVLVKSRFLELYIFFGVLGYLLLLHFVLDVK